jgi:protein-L-isoaspartate(D-aspartate) O-methyltransferase
MLFLSPMLGGVPSFEVARSRMVKEQLTGTARNITNAGVLRAMGTVPRHEFVPARLASDAYADCPLPIGYGQTISQPYVVAFMTQQLDLEPTDSVLEIGTGSGYQAAVLSMLVSRVHTIEIVPELAKDALAAFQRLGYTNIVAKTGDGYQGWKEAAPFDCIIVTCAPERIPEPLLEQLKEGGRMVIPVGGSGNQELLFLKKQGGVIQRQEVLPVRFVPMTGKARE